MKVLCLKQLRAKFKTDQDRNDDCDGSCPLFASRDIPAAMPTYREQLHTVEYSWSVPEIKKLKRCSDTAIAYGMLANWRFQ
jgi:hypothetical protein